ncbi:MAG: hypothetical protein ABIJ59_19320 [Pseudomonadota bacterium]
MLLTPVLYIVSLISCEKYLDQLYSDQIQNIIVGESKPLLEGSIRLEEQIAKNIQTFLKKDKLVNRYNLDINIFVSTKTGRILYPIFLDVNSLSKDMAKEFDSQSIAKNNYTLLNNGLVVKVESTLHHGSTVSLFILALYSFISFLFFWRFYKIGSSKAAKEREEKSKLITAQQKHLEVLKIEQLNLFKNIESLNKKYQKDKKKAKINEDEMFQEIISLEEKLNSFIELKQSKESEIIDLKSQIEKYERRKGSKNKRIDFDFIGKRFAALYKNVTMNRKSLSGFLNLNDDQQIKAEEIVFLLDREPEKVTIKRKVFTGKKHKVASFEVLFAYNGRLYFKTNDNNKIEILIIGTKNTQQKDMEFLHSL